MIQYYPVDEEPETRYIIDNESESSSAATCRVKLDMCKKSNEELRIQLKSAAMNLLGAETNLKRALSVATVNETILGHLRSMFEFYGDGKITSWQLVTDRIKRAEELNEGDVEYNEILGEITTSTNKSFAAFTQLHRETMQKASQELSNCQKMVQGLQEAESTKCAPLTIVTHFDKAEARTRGLWAVLKELEKHIANRTYNDNHFNELRALISRDGELNETDLFFLDALTKRTIDAITEWVRVKDVISSPSTKTSPTSPHVIATGPVHATRLNNCRAHLKDLLNEAGATRNSVEIENVAKNCKKLATFLGVSPFDDDTMNLSAHVGVKLY